MLTVQRPIVRAVIQDAIERTRANLMIANAFPSVFDTLEYIRDALVVAAEGIDKAEVIGRRLMYDNEYNNLMSWVVSAYFWIIKIANFFSASCSHSPLQEGS